MLYEKKYLKISLSINSSIHKIKLKKINRLTKKIKRRLTITKQALKKRDNYCERQKLKS